MKVLFDEDTPRTLRSHLPGHQIITVQEMGWAGIKNGRLLALAEAQDFEVLLTFDQNMPYQQNLVERKIGILIIVVMNKKLETIMPLVPEILATLPTVGPGSVFRVEKKPESQS